MTHRNPVEENVLQMFIRDSNKFNQHSRNRVTNQEQARQES